MIKNDMQNKEIDKNTKREMSKLSHSKFRTKLINKAESEGVIINECNERMTTQTCGRYFEIQEMKKEEEYKCTSCGIRIERDVNGARNVLINISNK